MPPPSAATALPRRAVYFAWTALAILPAIYIAIEFASASRNFPYWDEIDSTIDFLLKLRRGGPWSSLIAEFFALSNEHRTVTSRIIFALSYWATGTVNFHVIGALGNLFIVAACGLLVAATRTMESRIRLAVILSLLVFQLEHFENFIWSGASIDHFQVVMLAILTVIAVTRESLLMRVAALVFATLATFTLAHGCMTWLVGGIWFANRRSWRAFVAWTAGAAVVLTGYFTHFSFNPGHNIPPLNVASVPEVGSFWLQLLGAPFTLGQRPGAAWLGVALLGSVGLLLWRGALRRHSVPMLVSLFGIASLALIAYGRIHVTDEMITSRYLILGALAWAMTIHVAIEETTTADRPFRKLAWVTPALALLNITADFVYQRPKEAFVEARDRAATHFKSFGHAGVENSRIYPVAKRADEILTAAYSLGVYHLGRVSERVDLPPAEPNTGIVASVDELVANDRAVTVGGWAMLPGRVSKRGRVFLVLQSEAGTDTFTTLTLQRPDIARYYHEPKWRLCGFRAVIGRERLPARNYRIGVLIIDAGRAQYLMLTNQLALANNPAQHDRLASAR